MRHQLRTIVVLLFVTVALLPAMALAQATTGTISGAVTDESKAILPGVSIQVKNVETGATRTLVTDANGRYRALNPAPGIYAVTAELQGFVPATRERRALESGQDTAADRILNAAAVNEHVT